MTAACFAAKATYRDSNMLIAMRSIVAFSFLMATCSAGAVDFPKFPSSIKIVEANVLPIELIRDECAAINAQENISNCITNTINHWTSYQRSLEEHPEATLRCYESLKELDDYIVVNNCIRASIQ